MSSTVTRLDPLTDPTNEIPNREAKSRCHPRADLSRSLTIDGVGDIRAQLRPDSSGGSKAISMFRASRTQPCCAAGL